MKPATKFNILVIIVLAILLWWAITKMFILVGILCVLLLVVYIISSLTRETFKRILVRIKSKLGRKT